MSFLRFPGVAGSYVSTPDVNQLDGDSANLQQSVGDWGTLSDRGTPVLDTTLSPVFGTNHAKVTATADWSSTGGGPILLNNPPVTAGMTYSFVGSAAYESVATMFRWYIDWRDSGDVSLGVVVGDYAEPSGANSFVEFTYSATAPTGAVSARFVINARHQDGSAVTTGETIYFDAVCLREGTDPTFVPSLRIVPSPSVVVDPADMQWSYTVGDEFQIGDGWAGDGVSAVARDGIDGPIVAEFQVPDIGIEEGVVPPGTQWQDITGRTWTSSGSLEILDWLYGYPVEDLAAYLDAALPDGVQVYSHAADIGKLPAVVLVPGNPAIALTTMAGAEMTLAWGIEATLVVNRSQPLYGTRLLVDLWRQIATACIAYSETVQVLTLEEIGTVEWSGGEALAGTMPMILTQSEGI